MSEEIDRVDELSNKAVDAIHAKRFDVAEDLCRQLLAGYPEVIDGRWRLGMLREAQGQYQEAADCYGAVLTMIDEHPEGYDDEVVEYFRERRQETRSKLEPRT